MPTLLSLASEYKDAKMKTLQFPVYNVTHTWNTTVFSTHGRRVICQGFPLPVDNTTETGWDCLPK